MKGTILTCKEKQQTVSTQNILQEQMKVTDTFNTEGDTNLPWKNADCLDAIDRSGHLSLHELCHVITKKFIRLNLYLRRRPIILITTQLRSPAIHKTLSLTLRIFH